MARYLNPITANANVAINTAAATTIPLKGSTTTDVELTCSVDAGVAFGLAANPTPAPTTANVSANAVGTHFLPAGVPRGFGVAAGSQISVIALSANGAIWVSEMG